MEDIQIPKSFLTLLRIPEGPLKGSLVMPCMCREPIDLEDDFFIAKFADGAMMAVHPHCMRDRPDEDADI